MKGILFSIGAGADGKQSDEIAMKINSINRLFDVIKGWILNQIRFNALGTLSSDTSGTKTAIAINAYDGPTIKTGRRLLIQSAATGYIQPVVLAAALKSTATSLSIVSTDLGTIQDKSTFFLTSKELMEATTQHDSVHIHMYHTGGNNTNDYLPNFSQWNFNVNAGAILASGNSKPNRWVSQYGVYTAQEDCVIESVKGYFSTNGGADDNLAFTLWTKPPDVDGTANTNIDLVEAWSMRSQNNQNHIFEIVLTTPYEMSAGDVIIPTVKREGSSITSSSKLYGDIEISISYQK